MRKCLNELKKQGFSMCNALAAQDSTFKKYFKFKSLYKYEKSVRYAGKSNKDVQLFKMWLEFHLKTGINFLTNLVDCYNMITC